MEAHSENLLSGAAHSGGTVWSTSWGILGRYIIGRHILGRRILGAHSWEAHCGGILGCWLYRARTGEAHSGGWNILKEAHYGGHILGGTFLWHILGKHILGVFWGVGFIGHFLGRQNPGANFGGTF